MVILLLFRVLLDFNPEIVNGSQSRTITFYKPSAEYRLVDLTGGNPLVKIGIQVYWVDKIGNYYRLMISRYQSLDLKLWLL